MLEMIYLPECRGTIYWDISGLAHWPSLTKRGTKVDNIMDIQEIRQGKR